MKQADHDQAFAAPPALPDGRPPRRLTWADRATA